MTIWDAIQIDIRATGHEDFSIHSKISLSGGDINQSFHLSGNENSFFLKLNSIDNIDMFHKEKLGLETLSKSNSFRTPHPYSVGKFEDKSYLIMEYLELSNAGKMDIFAETLAKMHQVNRGQFGFESHNYIGSTKQYNEWDSNWGRFFCEQRLLPLLKLLSNKQESKGLLSDLEQLLKMVPKLLNEHKPKPALVHGDLWQGNYSFCTRGEPIIYDPACYYGDREVDLAMLELFGNPGEKFSAEYNLLLPVSHGFTIRKKIYNLYHLLNHTYLFGGSYRAQSSEMLKRILKLI